MLARPVATSLTALALVALFAPHATALQFSINAQQGAKPISPYIYGMNSFFNSLPTGGDSGSAIALDRLGGNRWTGYNWETNFSNAGSDFQHFNDEYLVNYVNNTPPGEAVRPSLVSAANHGRAVLVTVPTAGYVSADDNGAVSVAQTAPSSRWNQVVPNKSDIYSGSTLSLSPNENDDYVFTDEFVHWVESTKASFTPVFYGLDNEPGLWDSTHPRLHPGDPTFAELRGKVINHAGAIKDVAPDALVFGPTTFGWSAYQSLQGAPDQTSFPSHPGGNEPGEFNFLEWMLNELSAEEASQGRTLVDVLDVHWYPEATGGGTRITFGGVNNNSPAVVAARVQAPRSLWDADYVETSWITQFSTGGGPVKLLPRLQRDIDDFKPGTKIAVTEYNFGGGGHISGAIAQADVLGVFGEQGVFAGTWWNIEGQNPSSAPYVYGAFDMFRNYDGQGGAFGDVSIEAESDSIEEASVYASLDSQDPNKMVLVAINRTDQPLDATVVLESNLVFGSAEVFQLTSAGSNPSQAADLEFDQANAFVYAMPALSVTTLVLTAEGVAGDYNGDGAVDAADYTVWRDHEGEAAGSLMNDIDGGQIGAAQYLTWVENFGATFSPSSHAIPEPGAVVLLACCLLVANMTCARH